MEKYSISEHQLCIFIKKVYELSVPQGLGVFHAKEGSLSTEEAESLIYRSGRYAVDMDYVHGRACKMNVLRDSDGGLFFCLPWFDHTPGQGAELLRVIAESNSLNRPPDSAPIKIDGQPQ